MRRARASDGEIRDLAHHALDAGARIPGRDPIARGGGIVRRGRWAVSETTSPGVLVACEVTEDGDGAGILIGPPGFVLRSLPISLRQAWNAGDHGESDDDPPDAPGPVAPAPRDREPATPSARAR